MSRIPLSANQEAFVKRAMDWHKNHPQGGDPLEVDNLFYRNASQTRKLMEIAKRRVKAQQKRALKEPPLTLKRIFGDISKVVSEMQALELARGDHLLRD